MFAVVGKRFARRRREKGDVVPYWRLSGFYFFYFAALGSFLPYWPLYLQHLGFEPARIGFIMAIMAATKIVAPNVWGWIADRTGRGMTVIRAASFCSFLAFCAMSGYRDYLAMSFGTFVYSFFWNASLPCFEAVTLRHLRDRPESYSRIRLWGSIGFILGVLAVGRALDDYPVAWLPYVVASLLAGIWLVSLAVGQGGVLHGQAAEISFWRLLRHKEVLVFLAVAFLAQIAHGPYYVFFSLYLKSHGYSGSLTGQLWSLGVMAEVVLFLFMARLLRRVSLRGLLSICTLAGAVRWMVVAQAIAEPWFLAGAQLLHAATFGIAHVVAIDMIHRHFGGAHHNKGQALYNSVSFGLGGMLGSYSAGALWTQWGGAAVFSAAAGLSFSAFAIAWLGMKPPRKRGVKTEFP